MARSRSGKYDVEDWERELTRKDGHPVLATVIGAVVLIFAASSATANASDSSSIAYLIGYAFGGAAIVWAIAYAITIRHSGTGWAIGSFLVMAGISLLAVMIVLAVKRQEAMRKDVSAMLDLKMDAGGNVSVPQAQGPLSGLTLQFLTDIKQRGEQDQAKLVALGIDRIGDAEAVSRDPSLLRDCDRFNRARSIVDEGEKANAERFARLRADATNANLDAEEKRGFLDALETGDFRTRVKGGRDLVRRQLSLAADMCVALSHRRWQSKGKDFLFTNDADFRVYRQRSLEWNDLRRQHEAQMDEGRQKLERGQQEIRHGLGMDQP